MVLLRIAATIEPSTFFFLRKDTKAFDETTGTAHNATAQPTECSSAIDKSFRLINTLPTAMDTVKIKAPVNRGPSDI